MLPRGALAALALAIAAGCSGKPSPVATGQPPSSSGVAVGARAPDGQLTRATGTKVALAEVLHAHARTVLVFYRGFW